MPLASPQTPRSLLELARSGEQEAWRSLLLIYEPLLRHWLRLAEIPPADRDDLIQQILIILVRKLPSFQHNGRVGAFRAWLRGIVVREEAAFRRARVSLPGLTAPEDLDCLPAASDELTRTWDAEYERHVLNGLLDLVEPEFTSSTWQAFRRIALEGASLPEVAAELGMTVNAVTLAKSRVLRRLRQVARGLID